MTNLYDWEDYKTCAESSAKNTKCLQMEPWDFILFKCHKSDHKVKAAKVPRIRLFKQVIHCFKSSSEFFIKNDKFTSLLTSACQVQFRQGSRCLWYTCNHNRPLRKLDFLKRDVMLTVPPTMERPRGVNTKKISICRGFFANMMHIKIPTTGVSFVLLVSLPASKIS